MRPQHASHRDHKQRRGKRDTDPEPARHVAEFGIFFLRRGDRTRLERHAADRTRARLGANDLRMHRAGVLGACGGERDVGLEGHTAGRAGSGLGFPNFGTHGTNVMSLASPSLAQACGSRGRSRFRRRWLAQRNQAGGLGFIQIRLRISFEFCNTTGAAEVMLFSGVLVNVFGCGGVDIHPADRVAFCGMG